MPPHTAKPVAIWLFVCAAMTFAMVVIGGVTRLTGSGLSIVEWAPLMGWIPPLGDADWHALFAKYQQSPEFRLVNREFGLAQFQSIFWLEYIHRVVGRLTGLVFLLPLCYFAVRRQLERPLLLKLGGIFLLGGMQGVMGWLMVKSGLVDEPRVSHFRLAAHLGLAFLIHAAIVWVGLGLYFGTRSHAPSAFAWVRLRRWGGRLLALTGVTVLSGALVAGLRAGYAYNTFPLMDGRWFPEDYFLLEPHWHNPLHNVPAVQWDHRLLAILTLAAVVAYWWTAPRRTLPARLRLGLHLLLGMALVQVGLGIATLLLIVPVALASLHQAGAVVLFTIALFIQHQLCHYPNGPNSCIDPLSPGQSCN